MSCPTCDHTMQNLKDVIFWCPRCGTISDGADGGMFERPKLVDRCREFAKVVCGPKSLAAFNPKPLTPLVVLGAWITLGIAEAIHRPEERPT